MANTDFKKTKEQAINETHRLAQLVQIEQNNLDKLKIERSQSESDNSILTSKKLGLESEVSSLENDILSLRLTIRNLNSIAGERNLSLNTLNGLLIKLSKNYSDQVSKELKQLKKLEKIQFSYDSAVSAYDEITQKISEARSTKKKEFTDLKVVKNLNKTLQQESNSTRQEFEQFKSQQSAALKTMRFYAKRLNRYYKSLNLPAPIQMSEI